MRPAPAHDLVDPGGRPLGVAVLEAVRRLGDDVVGADRRVPVGEVQLTGGDETLGPALKADQAAVDQDVGGLGAVTASVHPDGSADRARYPDSPLESGEAGRRGSSRQHRVGGRSTRPHAVRLDPDAGEAVAEPYAQSVEPAVRDEQVRPLSEYHDRGSRSRRPRQPRARGQRRFPVR